MNPSIDLFCFSMMAFDSSRSSPIIEHSIIYPSEYFGNGQDVMADLILSGNFYAPAWLYIFKKSNINWKCKGFINMIHEDEEFTPRLFFASSDVFITRSIHYYYRKYREGSIMDSVMKRKKGQWLKSKLGYFISFISCIILVISAYKKKQGAKSTIYTIKLLLKISLLELLFVPVKSRFLRN